MSHKKLEFEVDQIDELIKPLLTFLVSIKKKKQK